MPIDQFSGGTMITGQGIPLFRLLALRGAVKLEAKGIRMSRRSVTAMAMKELGCKRKDVLAKLEAAIAVQGKKVEEENFRKATGACPVCERFTDNCICPANS
jgi:hypothetical protein